jgi:aminoglycoside 6'-N-acetyltransferase I
MEHRPDPIVSVITPEHDLECLVADINAAQWDEANEMSEYDVDSLSEYLNTPDNVFVACYAVTDPVRTLMGFASSRFQLKPYDRERWLYVDEVDVCVNQRRKGAGKAIMTTLINIARENDCAEVWLGTEPDNDAANALYRSLRPDEVEQFVGYTFEPDD